MSIVVVRRPERRPSPQPPRGEILLESPPEIPEVQPAGLGGVLMYVPMLAGGAAMGLMFTAGGHASPIMYVASGLFAISMLGMTAGQFGRNAGERKNRLNGLRRDYFRYLAQIRKRVRKAAVQQREALEWSGPAPDTLWWVAMGPRLWERRPRDDDFGTVRLGTGVQKLAVQLIPPDSKPVEDLDALTAGALRRFVRAHSTVSGLPVAVALNSFARIHLSGDPRAVRGLVRAMIAQLATFHSPDDMRILVCASREWMPHWDWVKWLPHALHPEEVDAAGQVRLMGENLAQLDQLVGDELKERARFRPGTDALPYHIVIVDGGHVPHDSQLGTDAIQGVTVIDLSDATGPVEESATLRLEIRPDGFHMVKIDHAGKRSTNRLGDPDTLDYARAEGLARQLAPLRASAGSGGESQDLLSTNTTLTDLLGVGDPGRLQPAVTWQPRAGRNRFRVPIGLGGDGRVVELDIKESAQGGMGPHGLVIGATGSGKSELLRTLVLGLAITHSSEILNFVLVDFKGGATFLGLDTLSHVSAVITNLEDELPLVDRMHDALHGEMVRRQELLRAAGNYASLRDYERAREQGADLQPMPTLFIVLDEFSELLAAKPEFIDLFVMIGRLGRSLGVHLLLASQRLEEGRLRGLDTHLSYRIGLRTFSAMESRVVLGVADAYELPSSPGNGYLKYDTTGMTRFKAAYVSGAHHEDPAQAVAADGQTALREVVEYGPTYMPLPEITGPVPTTPQPEGESASGNQRSLLDVVVGRLAGHGPPAHRIWLPPLSESATLAHLMPPLSVTQEHGLTTAGWAGRGKLHAVVGIVDKPFEQRRDPFWLDVSGSAGHVGVAGGTQSGKSTVMRTLVASMALTHTPREVQFYCLDFGGGALASLEGLPHVGGVASRLDAERVRRTVAEVGAILEQRERDFGEHGIESITTYRRLRQEGAIEGDGWGDVFLVVDGWLTLRQEFDSLEPTITDIAARGLGYGIHLVAATNKWSEFRPSIRDLLGTKIELKLGDAYESEVSRKKALAVPEAAPGRGLTKDGFHFLSALPRIDGVQNAADLAAGARGLVQAVRDSWQGPAAPPVRLLPPVLAVSALPDDPDRIPIGIDEASLSPVALDFDADPHFVVFGENESGKSNLLRLIAEGLVGRKQPSEAMMIVIDYRRSLLDSAATEHRIGYAASSAAATELINDARGALLSRLPPANLTSEQLRDRSWWQGSDLYIIVDDYDLVATSSNPLLPLVELLPQARDIGLHLVLARQMGGAGRAMFDPVIQRMKDMATPALLMSGSKEEGFLFGNVRPQTLPQGRGYLVDRRSGARLMQTAYLDAEPTGGERGGS
ncbi:type VII secretion protein EccCa [Nonomuraea turcica]|uniref:type VII secretion protein EccCa n=1 Tax=Nonomuraea sp. G32 TaxID=3067274 RepID=UPI00273C29F6|nr:type VII secretion protein EccCa [Nonomuraea sp. G32]MDP4506619.1 type VII secretion protein EccCa [Nonomuraea sp. G32]